MEYVFGSKFVCFSLDAAKKIAFHPQIMTSTITIDGDHFDPDGILTGGARAERSNILVKLGEMKANIDELNAKKAEISALEGELAQEREKSISYSRLKQELDLHLNQLNLAQLSLEQTSHHQNLEKDHAIILIQYPYLLELLLNLIFLSTDF